MGDSSIRVRHFAKGRLIPGGRSDDVVHRSRDRETGFSTPVLALDDLLWPRDSPLPAYGLPMADIIDFLEATGKALDLDTNEHMQWALDAAQAVNVLSPRVLESYYRGLAVPFDRELVTAEIENSLGDGYDGWRTLDSPRVGQRIHVRACPARLVHVLAGNSPGVGAISIVRGALSRGVSLLKLPSNEPFSTIAVLATMADIDPDHPTVRSMSAAYWRGGDAAIESVIYRPQFVDKIVAWGGESAMRNVQQYLGPGIELIAMDPKVSVSMIGREAFQSTEALRDAAARGGQDVGNQEGCVNSRYQFVEGTIDQVDRYCEALYRELGVERATVDGQGHPTPADVRDEVEVLRQLEPAFRVWGTYDGRGLVVRSDDPVEFHPSAKTVNVVAVDRLADAIPYANVATQTVGVYPTCRRAEVRDGLAQAGTQRVVTLGAASQGSLGRPHDGMIVLHRMVRWVVDID